MSVVNEGVNGDGGEDDEDSCTATRGGGEVGICLLINLCKTPLTRYNDSVRLFGSTILS